MEYTIDSYVGVGDLRFGMSLDEVRGILGHDYETVDTFETSDHCIARDMYDPVGIFVDFCYPGILVAVELFKPADPVLLGEHILRLSYSELVEWFKARNPDLVIDYADHTSYALGVAFYCPERDDDAECPVEAVMAFERDHYTKKYPKP